LLVDSKETVRSNNTRTATECPQLKG
jgi:hypothetical protein